MNQNCMYKCTVVSLKFIIESIHSFIDKTIILRFKINILETPDFTKSETMNLTKSMKIIASEF